MMDALAVDRKDYVALAKSRLRNRVGSVRRVHPDAQRVVGERDAQMAAVEVDVFVVEGNAARAAAALLAPTHFLAACLAMDLVFVRRNSAPAARWRWTRGDKAAAAAAAPDAAAALDARCPQFAAELRPLARALDEVAPARMSRLEG